MSKDYRTIRDIEDDLSRHRSELVQGLGQLQQRLSFDGVVEGVKQVAADNVGELSGSLSKAVRANPLAIAMIGTGIVWLISGKFPGRSSDRKPAKTKPDAATTLSDWHDEGGAVWAQPELPAPDLGQAVKRPHRADNVNEE